MASGMITRSIRFVVLSLAVLLAVAAPAGAAGKSGTPDLRDDGERFVAFYGQFPTALTVEDTWRALRGMRFRLDKLGLQRRVAALVYYVGKDLYMAAADFTANEVFIDRVSGERAYSLVWRNIEPDFQPGWSPRAPDRIDSTDPERHL